MTREEQLVTTARRLRELRGRRTLQEVHDATGIEISTLSNYEQGIRIPTDDNKRILARYYGKTVDDIFFTSEVHSS